MAFIILVLATGNILIALFSILSITLTILCVIGCFVFRGYEVGAIESLSMVFLIGFSIDYVCHLSAHYVHSEERKRYDKATESVRDMGVSIFSGGITTLGSAGFLFFG